MYSLKAIFQKQPAVIAGAVRSVLFILVLAGLVAWEEQLLAGIALALEVVLSLFVWNQSTSATFPVVKSGTEVAIEGSEDTVIARSSPPGSTDVEGGTGG